MNRGKQSPCIKEELSANRRLELPCQRMLSLCPVAVKYEAVSR